MTPFTLGDLRQCLIEAGYHDDHDDGPTPDTAILWPLTKEGYGPSTLEAVKAFQAAHRPLVVDGVAGPNTLVVLRQGGGPFVATGWKMAMLSIADPRQFVLARANAQIGVHEVPDGSNRGPEIDRYTGLSGKPLSVPGPRWCAYSLSYDFGSVPSTTAGSCPWGVIGSAHGIYQWAEHHGKLLAAGVAPEPCDAFVILRKPLPDGTIPGHCGLIVYNFGDGRAATIEGNARNAKRGLIRPIASFTGIVRV